MDHQMPARLVFLFFCLLSLAGAFACGSDKPKKGQEEGNSAPSEKAFITVAKNHKIPSRLLTAVAFVESHITAKPASAIYSQENLGPQVGQSAFGLTRSTLGVPEGEGGDRLSLQIEAYGRWLAKQLAGGLSQNLESDEDKFNWIWHLAELHRQDDSTRILFAREMIEALNTGFHWVDPETQTVVTFPPEEPSIDTNNLRPVSRNHLQLVKLIRHSPEDIPSARFVVLHNQHHFGREQKPRGIDIIHCPFSYSACVEMQAYDGKQEKNFWLGAHYIIPANAAVSEYPLQTALHRYAVPQLSPGGKQEFSQDKVVIMLTGYAGRQIAGKRMPADPSWLNSWQLQRMGELVHDICDHLNSLHEGSANPLSLGECMAIGKGTHFQFQDGSTPFRWGDIPDFDPAIFASYIHNPENLISKTVFEAPNGKRVFTVAEGINLNLTFGLRVRLVQLDRLVRCADERVVWTPIAKEEVRSLASFLFEKHIYDAGPNLDGSHFFRAKVFGENGEMLGWDLATAYLSDYEQGKPMVLPDVCNKF